MLRAESPRGNIENRDCEIRSHRSYYIQMTRYKYSVQRVKTGRTRARGGRGEGASREGAVGGKRGSEREEGRRRVSGWALFIDSNEKVAVGA